MIDLGQRRRSCTKAALPLVVLARVATIIASQAAITGSLSLTRQAMHLVCFPGLRNRQTYSR